MVYQASKKKLVRLLSVAVFSSLLFVGTIGVNSAQAEMLDGSLKNLEYCDDGSGNDLAEKFKLIDIASFDITQAGTVMTASIVVTGGSTFTMSGNTISKSPRAGVFQIFGNDGGTGDLAMNGKYKLNDVGTLLKVAGIFQAQDLGDLCISAGKFKAVNLAP